MSRVRSKDTSLERSVRSKLFSRGLRFRKHDRSLPGNPDIVFPTERVAVFINGNFWHGYRFPAWQKQLSPKWRAKIAATRTRDRRNSRRLRARGWTVLNLWEHELRRDFDGCVARVIDVHSQRSVEGVRPPLSRVIARDRDG